MSAFLTIWNLRRTRTGSQPGSTPRPNSDKETCWTTRACDQPWRISTSFFMKQRMAATCQKWRHTSLEIVSAPHRCSRSSAITSLLSRRLLLQARRLCIAKVRLCARFTDRWGRCFGRQNSCDQAISGCIAPSVGEPRSQLPRLRAPLAEVRLSMRSQRSIRRDFRRLGARSKSMRNKTGKVTQCIHRIARGCLRSRRRGADWGEDCVMIVEVVQNRDALRHVTM